MSNISLMDISIMDILVMDIKNGCDALSRNNSLTAEQLTDSAYYIMLSLLTPRHGYGIMKYIEEELTNGEVTIGSATMYTLIKKLQEADYILLDESDTERRKTYTATEKGKAITLNEIERRARMAHHGKIALESVWEAKTNE
jgi:DNA-binding PadR family transcriptional regulator